MALLGTGAVAIWHDIAPEGLSAFYDWHGREHMPERVGIPGFRRGRRYVAAKADLQFFNLYEADGIDVLRGEGYRARLENPTPWTVETVKHFRRVNRSICTVARSHGTGAAGLVATWRYDVPDARADGERLWENVLLPLAEEHGVAGVHLLVADRDASAVDTAERKARGGEANVVPSRAVLVEGWGDEADFADLLAARIPDEALRAEGAEGPIASGLYRLQLHLDASA